MPTFIVARREGDEIPGCYGGGKLMPRWVVVDRINESEENWEQYILENHGSGYYRVYHSKGGRAGFATDFKDWVN